ncbi:hypothetical protein BDV11DRAFT_78362 [Aspergillus similis]
MESLTYEQSHSRHATIRTVCIKTCQWLLSAEKHEEWLDTDHFDQHCGFLWFNGSKESRG